MDETSKNASRILLQFVTDKDAKVRYGKRQRDMMIEAVERGEQPKGYRIEWLDSTAQAIFQLLSEKGAEFNNQHPQDRVSTDDFDDALETCQARLRTAAKR